MADVRDNRRFGRVRMEPSQAITKQGEGGKYLDGVVSASEISFTREATRLLHGESQKRGTRILTEFY